MSKDEQEVGQEGMLTMRVEERALLGMAILNPQAASAAIAIAESSLSDTALDALDEIEACVLANEYATTRDVIDALRERPAGASTGGNVGIFALVRGLSHPSMLDVAMAARRCVGPVAPPMRPRLHSMEADEMHHVAATNLLTMDALTDAMSDIEHVMHFLRAAMERCVAEVKHIASQKVGK